MSLADTHTVKRKSLIKSILALSGILVASPALMAQGAMGAPKESSMADPMVILLVVIMLILLLIIALLANVVLGAAGYFSERTKKEMTPAETSKEPGKVVKPTVAALVTGLLFFSGSLHAQGGGQASQVASTAIGGISETAFYFMISVIFLELVVVFALLYNLRIILAREKARKTAAVAAGAAAKKVKPKESWWSRFNRFRPVEQEAQIDLGHDYDGIRELDNRLPPWWLYGFYASILFAMIYLWRYHVAHSAPLSAEEFRIAMQKAEVEKAEYLKHTASLVDENTVKQLTDPEDIAAGKTIFEQNCSPCHGKEGQGIVGPNLTDDYWLHGGRIQDIFKSIKYGWQEKGMRSWKDDFSPGQIAQVASFIKSIHGSHPANPKDPQGDLFKDDGGGRTDSVATKNKIADNAAAGGPNQ